MTKTYKIGSMSEFFDSAREAVRTKTPMEPKAWYASEDDRVRAEAREATAREVESAVKLICDNLEITKQIASHEIASVKQLAEHTGRSSASLSRTLQRMEELDIVKMSPGAGRVVAPTLKTDRLYVELNLRNGRAMLLKANQAVEGSSETAADSGSIFQEDYRVDIERLAVDSGLKVYVENLVENDVSGKIMRSDAFGGPSGYAIVVNGREAAVRQRYTIAHEVAHYELHRSMIGDGITENAMLRSARVSDRQEREANARAAEMLMPAESVKRARRHYAVLADMARAFDVSKDAMSIRLKTLGLEY